MRIIVIYNEAQRQRALTIMTRMPISPAKQITIEDYSPRRSLQQNRRYWLWVNMVAKHVGHEPDEIHEMMKEKFLGTRVIEIAGERAQVSPSTRKLKVKDFREYVDKCEEWAIEKLGVWLDAPGDGG